MAVKEGRKTRADREKDGRKNSGGEVKEGRKSWKEGSQAMKEVKEKSQ